MANKKRVVNVGDKFNFLTIVKEVEPYINPTSNQRIRNFECECVCGTRKNIRMPNFPTTKSCGCMKGKINSEINLTHGMSKTGEYRSWRAMKARCLNSNHKNYFNYGGRGILICDRWKNSFENFFKDMGNRPSLNYTLDRIDSNGNYEPSNCKWSTYKEQANNTRSKKNKNGKL